MSLRTLTNPSTLRVGRSELRQNQSSILEKAKGNAIVVVTSGGEEDKFVLDKMYFEELVSQLKSAAETLEITSDPELLSRILAVSKTIDEDIRLGKLHSFEEAFGDNEES
jgi:hypothetical protein